jgi:uncharacterized membrane protein
VITEWLMGLGASLVQTLLGALPPVEVPAWVAQGSGKVSEVMAIARSLSAWVPIDLAGGVVVAVIACLIAGLGIKVARIVASFMTVGGGSAG